MYILVTCKKQGKYRKRTLAFNGEDEVKSEVVKLLDARGWDDKHKVDLRKLQSCLEYILDGTYTDIKYKFSSSLKKYNEYKYGTYAIVE